MINRVVIMGRLTRDPELRYTPQQNAVCTITVAVDRAYTKPGEQREADFFDVVCWRQTAELVSKYFTKGRMIAVEGRLQSRKWKDKFDQNRVSMEIMSDSISFCGDKSSAGGNEGSASNSSQTGNAAYGGSQGQSAYGGIAQNAPEESYDTEDDDVPF